MKKTAIKLRLNLDGGILDNRTKRQKLKAMADQTVSPQEAEIAKQKLAVLPPDPIIHQTLLIIRYGGITFTMKVN